MNLFFQFKKVLASFLAFSLFVLSCTHVSHNIAGREVASTPEGFPKWAYDSGPNPNTKEGKALIDLYADIPNFGALSEELTGDQKFRPAFGPVPWRMLQKANSVKILFIGQDATHIAEAAGRPATAGFGGRAQDLAKYFGVSSGAAFINTYAFTIKGQYGSFDSPVIKKNASGVPSVSFGSFVDNHLWLLSQDLESPLTQWRNNLIEWIIRNNKDSLKLIVLFGGAARDAAATFIESKGGKVGSRLSSEALKNIEVPEMDLKYAGGNNEAAVPLDKNGKDIYEKLLGRKPKYENPQEIAAGQTALREKISAVYQDLALTKGGLQGSGIIHPAQLGGYDLDKQLEINGEKTLSLKGLKINSSLTIEHDLLVAQLPHPSALSRMQPSEASKKVGQALQDFQPYVSRGWKIEADAGLENSFDRGEPYKYGRSSMGPEYYDFGAPASRMVDVSSASRLSPNIIVFGTRDRAKFDERKLEEMTEAKPSEYPGDDDLWLTRSRDKKGRYVFDAGPGGRFARIMKENIPDDLLEKFDTNRDFGHYRGTFVSPRALIVADPDGYDDLITARALTGTRGQYLQGMMQDLGIEDQYLVIKTAPFSKDDKKDWELILARTNSYREKLFKEVAKIAGLEFILCDGEDAANEVSRILGSSVDIPVITIQRQGLANRSGLKEAVQEIAKNLSEYKRVRYQETMKDIPRSHMSFYARLWEGTSGDRVITSSDPKFAGKAFAEVAPEWAYRQKSKLTSDEAAALKELEKKLKSMKLRLGTQSVRDFMNGITR